MTMDYLRVLRPLGFSWLMCGCSVTRPVPVAIDAPALSAYLAEHPAANLRVTEHSGKRYWVHAPKIQGDSLIGRHGYDVPVRPAGVHLHAAVELRAGHFSLGRTGAAIGGRARGRRVGCGNACRERSTRLLRQISTVGYCTAASARSGRCRRRAAPSNVDRSSEHLRGG